MTAAEAFVSFSERNVRRSRNLVYGQNFTSKKTAKYFYGTCYFFANTIKGIQRAIFTHNFNIVAQDVAMGIRENRRFCLLLRK